SFIFIYSIIHIVFFRFFRICYICLNFVNHFSKAVKHDLLASYLYDPSIQRGFYFYIFHSNIVCVYVDWFYCTVSTTSSPSSSFRRLRRAFGRLNVVIRIKTTLLLSLLPCSTDLPSQQCPVPFQQLATGRNHCG